VLRVGQKGGWNGGAVDGLLEGQLQVGTDVPLPLLPLQILYLNLITEAQGWENQTSV